MLGFFGIHSPSRVFASMGRNLMEGMAVGINDGASMAVDAANAAAAQVSAASQVSYGVNATTAGAMGLPMSLQSGGGPFGGTGSSLVGSDSSVLGDIRDALRDLRNRPTVDIGQIVTQANETCDELAQRLAFMARTA